MKPNRKTYPIWPQLMAIGILMVLIIGFLVVLIDGMMGTLFAGTGGIGWFTLLAFTLACSTGLLYVMCRMIGRG